MIDPAGASAAKATGAADSSERVGAPGSPDPTSSPDPTGSVESSRRAVPTSQPILARALRLGALVGVLVLVAVAACGAVFAGVLGGVSAAVGAACALVLLMVTVVSILVANRFVQSDLYVVLFFAIVLGSWLLKMVLFLVVTVLVRDQDWLDGRWFFIGLLSGVLASLVVDAVVVSRARQPILSSAAS